MKTTFISKNLTLLYLLTALLFFTYTLIRVFNLSITYDEAWTLTAFVPLKVKNILSYTPCDANNHILNTLSVKGIYQLGLTGVWASRLPSLISFALYLYFGYKTCSKYCSKKTGYLIYLLLLLNPFVLDFFSLCRGYGIALGFQLTGLYFFITFIHKQQISYLLLALTALSLAVLSNFSWLNIYIATVFTICVYIISTRDIKKIVVTWLSSIAVTLILASIIYTPIKLLKETGKLYYGGELDFYTNTLKSITKYSLYTPNVNMVVEISLFIFVVIFVLVSLISLFLRYSVNSIKTALVLLLIVAISSVIAQHYILGTLYPIDRAALYFYPIFILVLGISLSDIQAKYKHTYKYVITLLVIPFCINFAINANLYKTALWYFDAHTHSILSYINEVGKEKDQPQKIDFSWPFQSGIYYYKDNKEYPYIEVVKNIYDREDLNVQFDYYIYLDHSLEKVGYNHSGQKINNIHTRIIKHFPIENIYLYQRSNTQ